VSVQDIFTRLKKVLCKDVKELEKAPIYWGLIIVEKGTHDVGPELRFPEEYGTIMLVEPGAVFRFKPCEDIEEMRRRKRR